MIDFIKHHFQLFNNKNNQGLINELLVSGNLSKFGLSCKVLNDNNPNYDIKVSKGNRYNYLECKLDLKVEATRNLYFEYWNYTNNRKTGINNDNLNTLYSHTFVYNGQFSMLIGKRQLFIDCLKRCKHKKSYNHTFIKNGRIMGDKAYIVKVDEFVDLFQGHKKILKAVFNWGF